ncbi:hypothetical protein [Pontibacillus litoralis]|uniref:Uncharacterized protein n=1 Tax=Pontibacillus litoralis JSM 072002 TaxID=1385512 RepID=A0A0A5G226_9BACI|nr:hypothetical protein [Pontibacillus litoralis]KGX85193.1 hypothetical protein N784_09865 [Pontibacillus litoralis JSM 072002]
MKSVKKKIIFGVVTASLLVGTGTGVYAYNQHQQELEREAHLEQLRAEKLEKAEETVEALYNPTKTRLAKNINKKIKTAEAAVKEVEGERNKAELTEEIDTVKDLAEIQNEVESTLINGVLANGVTPQQLEETSQKLEMIQTVNDPIFNHLSKKLSKAENQLKELGSASNAVAIAEDSIDRKSYDSAKKLVGKVKNKKEKEELNQRLAVLNENLVAMEKEAERKKEEQERLAAAAKKEEVTQQQNVKSSNPSKQPNKNSYDTSSKSDSTVTSSSANTNDSSDVSSNQSNGGATSDKSSSNSSGRSSNQSLNESSSNKSSGSREGTKLDGAKKVDGGYIDNDGNTYESWIIEDDGSIPWDEF